MGEYIHHPTWSNDGEAYAVCDVVEARQRVFDGMQRPSALAVPQGIYTIAAQCAGVEYLRARVVILRVL